MYFVQRKLQLQTADRRSICRVDVKAERYTDGCCRPTYHDPKSTPFTQRICCQIGPRLIAWWSSVMIPVYNWPAAAAAPNVKFLDASVHCSVHCTVSAFCICRNGECLAAKLSGFSHISWSSERKLKQQYRPCRWLRRYATSYEIKAKNKNKIKIKVIHQYRWK